jgi:NADH-quinone oxidoreductase subunit L
MFTIPVLIFLLLLIPLGTSLLLLVWGRRFGEPLSGYLGTGTAMLVFGLAVTLLVTWIYQGANWGFEKGPYLDFIPWLPVGVYQGQRYPGFLELSVYVDSLSVAMITMVALVTAVVHLFSLGYMRHDPRYPQFFCYLSLFGFCMTGLLVSGSLLQQLIFFELVGLCSYLLIGFWRHQHTASMAALKAFVTNRVGDVGFIIGIALLVAYFGTTTLPDLWLILSGTSGSVIMSYGVLTVVGVLLAFGAFGKSAQFPLHTWLADAMVGPTPVSALIHAATMVAAGVFLLARLYPILTPDARLFILIIGGVTILIGSLCALAQRDLKKALAFSTSAQLGYMVLAIGVGSWTGAMFHLLTHAFFKALLFLGAGSVIHAMHHDGRLEHFGGLWRRMPVTAVTFAIGILAMSGTPFLSGFYSKDMILAHTAAYVGLASEQHRSIWWELVFWMPVLGAYLTPLYLARLWMLIFAGRTRKRQWYRHAQENGVMSFPLVVLAGLSVVAGYSWFPVRSLVEGTIRETKGYFQNVAVLEPIKQAPLDSIWPVLPDTEQETGLTDEGTEGREQHRTPTEQRVQQGYERVHKTVGWAWWIGIVGGILVWSRGVSITDRMARFGPIGLVRHCLVHRMYFDDLYDMVFVGTVHLLSGLADGLDRYVIDPVIDAWAGLIRWTARVSAWADDLAVDGVVRGIGQIFWSGGGAMRLTQSGRVRVYVASAVGIAMLVMVCILILELSQ